MHRINEAGLYGFVPISQKQLHKIELVVPKDDYSYPPPAQLYLGRHRQFERDALMIEVPNPQLRGLLRQEFWWNTSRASL